MELLKLPQRILKTNGTKELLKLSLPRVPTFGGFFHEIRGGGERGINVDSICYRLLSWSFQNIFQ